MQRLRAPVQDAGGVCAARASQESGLQEASVSSRPPSRPSGCFPAPVRPKNAGSSEIDENERGPPKESGPTSAGTSANSPMTTAANPGPPRAVAWTTASRASVRQPRIALDPNREPIGSNSLDQRGSRPAAEIDDQTMRLAVPSDSRRRDCRLGVLGSVSTPEI